jgi:hypothetical protein
MAALALKHKGGDWDEYRECSWDSTACAIGRAPNGVADGPRPHGLDCVAHDIRGAAHRRRGLGGHAHGFGIGIRGAFSVNIDRCDAC